jgi:hypothetical protein
MVYAPKKNALIECKVKGFERGPFGLFGLSNFYGVIRKTGAKLNGCLGRVQRLGDWVNLMSTECIAGLTSAVNYRVVDITENIFDVKGTLPANAVVHMVVNRPTNREQILHSWPARNYYDYCWKGVKAERTKEFAEFFLKHGGFKTNKEAQEALDKLAEKSRRKR